MRRMQALAGGDPRADSGRNDLSRGERDNTDALLDNVSLTLDRPNGGVPEPAAWALMLSGFAAAGVALRHRRTAVA